MAGQRQFNVEKLSGEAQALVHRMLDRRDSPYRIARAVRQRSGEQITRSSVRRYAARYRAGQQQREEGRRFTEVLTERLQQQGWKISELLRAAFQEAFTETRDSGKLEKTDPLDWEAAERKRQELALKERQVQVAERRAAVFEQRWRLDRQKAKAALQKLDRKAQLGESLSAEDVKRIREIYGLYEEDKEAVGSSQ